MDRQPGLSVRLKLTLSYAGFVMLAGALLLVVVWLHLLRYVPEEIDTQPLPSPGAQTVWRRYWVRQFLDLLPLCS